MLSHSGSSVNMQPNLIHPVVSQPSPSPGGQLREEASMGDIKCFFI